MFRVAASSIGKVRATKPQFTHLLFESLSRRGLTRHSSTKVFFSTRRDEHYRQQLQDAIFDMYRDEAAGGRMHLPTFFNDLASVGIRNDDPRLRQMIKTIREMGHLEENGLFGQQDGSAEKFKEQMYISREQFQNCIGNSSIGVVGKALKKQLVIPDWASFTTIMDDLFESTREHNEGQVANYIPQLAKTNPNLWSMSICTVDGQRQSWGDADKHFCLQSVSKAFLYALVHDELGPEQLHSYIGQEPSGRLFNDICLDYNHRPHNPLINAGAILATSLMKMKDSLADRFDFAIRQMRRFAGCQGHIGFNNSVFLSERETADRNYALSYYMREYACFPSDTDIQDTLDLYFQLCSIETNCDTLAVMAGTFANGGVNPLTDERLINNRACRDVLSLMYSCGMYDWSGQFAFRVGLPAKSGVSGDMMIVIPNVMGIALYSPRLDTLGNTVRGVKLAEALIQKFNFHNYDSLVYSDCQKIDPRRSFSETDQDQTIRFLYAAKLGDIPAMKRYLLLGWNVHDRDYDERTALHVSASEGNVGCLEFLLNRWKESPEPKDRFGKTPLDDANFFGHADCAKVLTAAREHWKITAQD